jgi:hypothetical protein
LHKINGGNFPPTWTAAEVQQRVQLQRYGLQWPATIGFYAAWGASVLEGRQSWTHGQGARSAHSVEMGKNLRVTLHYEF